MPSDPRHLPSTSTSASPSLTRTRSPSSSRSPEPEPVSPSILPRAEDAPVPEVSMVEASEVTGVSFRPELWMQRRAWALEVLRQEEVSSVLDLGCGPGALLETLIIPPPTVKERPVAPSAEDRAALGLDKDAGGWEEQGGKELFIERLGALDNNPALLPAALSTLSPGASPASSGAYAQSPSSFTAASGPASTSSPSAAEPASPSLPRWAPLTAELWLGNIERYNSRLEGYEAIVALEVIEHLDQRVLDRFGVVCLGTYRPKVLLISTPNFDFNSKFPRGHEHESDFGKKGFMDPTGRTERVFRHSDHKLEWTFSEFSTWAVSSAADWGYTVSVSGVGVSSSPSYYPDGTPIYATSTACFRLQAAPMRSPRSVRSTQLPFMPGSREESHPHKLAGRFQYPVNVNVRPLLGGSGVSAPSNAEPGSGPAAGTRAGTTKHKEGRKAHSSHPHGHNHHSSPRYAQEDPAEIRRIVRRTLEGWGVGSVSLAELWGAGGQVAIACGGSKRVLVGALGGYGDVPPASSSAGTTLGGSASADIGTGAGAGAGAGGKEEGEYELRWAGGRGLTVSLRGARVDERVSGSGEGMDWESTTDPGDEEGKRGVKRAAATGSAGRDTAENAGGW